MEEDLCEKLKYYDVYNNVLKVVEEAHHGQFRKDGVTPYVLHPIRCSKIAADVYNNENRELEILMLTHDVVEDCMDYYKNKILKVIDATEIYFSSYSVGAIEFALKCITKPDKVDGVNRKERFELYMATIMSSKLAIYGKIIDRIDNLREYNGVSTDFMLDVYLPESYYILDCVQSGGYKNECGDSFNMLKETCKEVEMIYMDRKECGD